MFDLSFNLSDPSKDSYYIPFLIGSTTIILILQLIIILLKDYRRVQNQDIDISMDKTLQDYKDYPIIIATGKNTLKSRYLIAYIITRAATWAKAPYIYTLLTKVHGFSKDEIGILYLIEAVAALILGPITGQLADKYGRRLFCHYYNFSIILNLLLLIKGNRLHVYLSQIVSGFGTGLISTIFEAWVVSETETDFGGYIKEAEKFRKKLFVESNVYDAFMGINISIICALIYSSFGIFAPFWFSIFLSLAASIVISILWDENNLQLTPSEDIKTQLKNAIGEFKQMEVICVGLMEGIAMTSLNIFLFSWTPILKQSTFDGIKEGFIFILIVLTKIVNTKLFELLIIYLYFDYYISIAGCLFFQGLILFLVYYVDSFLAKMIFLALFNGLTGFYNPLNSIVKSNILVEKYRALLMNLFRVPLNIYKIIILFTLINMNSFTVALIAGIMCFVASLIGIFLVIYSDRWIWHFKKFKNI